MIRIMGKAEILTELPRLSAPDRAEILDLLCRLAEEAGPTTEEKTLLNDAQAAYEVSPMSGGSWEEVEARLRRRS
jgi:hypothetical protein